VVDGFYSNQPCCVFSGKTTEKASFLEVMPGQGKPFTNVDIHTRRYHTAFVPSNTPILALPHLEGGRQAVVKLLEVSRGSRLSDYKNAAGLAGNDQ
jgi:hypothetical protein